MYHLNMKRLDWDKYFMALAEVSKLRSKDPNTQVGAAIAGNDKRVVGLGYNGMPKGDDTFPWGREGEKKDTKYPYVIHAEMNAVLNAKVNISGTTLYTTLYPCSNCAKFVAQAGIKEIVFMDNIYEGTEDQLISKNILDKVGIKVRQMEKIQIEIK